MNNDYIIVDNPNKQEESLKHQLNPEIKNKKYQKKLKTLGYQYNEILGITKNNHEKDRSEKMRIKLMQKLLIRKNN